MASITFTPSMLDLLDRNGLRYRPLALITDDGGGKYSLQGGACSIGTKFTLIALNAPDPDYAIPLMNDAGVTINTSDYDLMFLEPGLTMDFQNGSIHLKDNAHTLDSSVRIAEGSDVIAAFAQGILMNGKTC